MPRRQPSAERTLLAKDDENIAGATCDFVLGMVCSGVLGGLVMAVRVRIL